MSSSSSSSSFSSDGSSKGNEPTDQNTPVPHGMVSGTEYPDTPENIPLIRFIYFLGFVLWIILVVFLELWPRNWLEGLILLIPPVLFTVAAATAGYVPLPVERWLLRANYLQASLIIIFPILIWATARVDSHAGFLRLILVATGLAILTLLDLWVLPEWFPLLKHGRSILSVMSISMVLLALHHFYRDRITDHGVEVDDQYREEFGDSDGTGALDDAEVLGTLKQRNKGKEKARMDDSKDDEVAAIIATGL